MLRKKPDFMGSPLPAYDKLTSSMASLEGSMFSKMASAMSLQDENP
jgi:hypothetical protein